MIKNRSVPEDVILPHLTYENVAHAIDWLTAAFGFVEHFRYGEYDSPQGAQMHLGEAWIMLNSARPGSASPNQAAVRSQSLTIFVDDVEAHFEMSKAAGAVIVEDPHETEYGEFQCAVQDLAGHLWIFSRHARDLSPEDWGATISRPL